jgi:hypothetical protein
LPFFVEVCVCDRVCAGVGVILLPKFLSM